MATNMSPLIKRIAELHTAESSDGQDYIQAFDVYETIRRYEEDHITLSSEEFGALVVCAIRYCEGRQTYMPGLIRDIVRPHLAQLDDKDIGVLLNGCRLQKQDNNYGSETIDKPGWLKWEQELLAEKERRANQ